MRSYQLSELIDQVNPAWPLVQRWIMEAKNPVEVLPVDRARAAQTLLRLQITTNAPMGALILETGGLLADYGWLRILSSGCMRLQGNLLSWNGLGQEPLKPAMKGAFLIAYDVVGGFFMLNNGAFAGQQGSVFYLAPDTLEWEDMEMTYSQFLCWAMGGELDTFYENTRWPGWRREVVQLSGDEGIAIYPPLWEEGGAIATRQRNVLSMLELWHQMNQMRVDK